MGKSKYTKEILEKLVAKHVSVSSMLRELGINPASGTHRRISKMIIDYEIDTTHFLPGHVICNLHDRNTRTKEEFINEILIEKPNIIRTSHSIKLSLFKFGIFEEKCYVCNIKNIWNGLPLSLHLEHINGNHDDNRLENLTILCPNCHSQTGTYAGKKRK